MFKLTFKPNGRLLKELPKSYQQTADDEWSTRLKNVEIKGENKSEASVTVIDGYENDLVDISGTLYRFTEDGAVVIVYADDTELFFGSIYLNDAVDFANKMITLLSTNDVIQ